MDIFKHKPTRQWFPCSRDSCFLSVFPVSPSNCQVTWQYQIRLSKINLFNHYLPKESCFPDILKRVTVELMDFQHLEPPNKGMVKENEIFLLDLWSILSTFHELLLDVLNHLLALEQWPVLKGQKRLSLQHSIFSVFAHLTEFLKVLEVYI